MNVPRFIVRHREEVLVALLLGASFVTGGAVAAPVLIAHPPTTDLEQTEDFGSDWGGFFKEGRIDGSILTGFVVHTEQETELAVVGIRGIYEGPKGRTMGDLHGEERGAETSIEARPGYAVSGLSMRSGMKVDGFQVYFMKLLPGGAALNPADFYLSEWAGGTGGGAHFLGNDGRLVLGFCGHSGRDVNALGLMQPAPASFDPVPVQILSYDEASNYPLGWEAAGGKGVGFSAWSFTDSDPARTKALFGIGSSASNGTKPPSGGIDSAGKSWMMYAAPGEECSASRAFAGGPLLPGQQFSLRMDNGDIESDGAAGFALQNAAGVDRVEFFFKGGQPHYQIACNGATLDTTLDPTSNGLIVIFTQLAGNHFLLDVRLGRGQFAAVPGIAAASDISKVKLYARGTGREQREGVFWNALTVQQPPGGRPFTAPR